jgi:N-methylhydantoinase A
MAFFPDAGAVETPIHELGDLVPDQVHAGPAIVETPFTTIVVDPQASFWHSRSGSLIIKP